MQTNSSKINSTMTMCDTMESTSKIRDILSLGPGLPLSPTNPLNTPLINISGGGQCNTKHTPATSVSSSVYQHIMYRSHLPQNPFAMSLCGDTCTVPKMATIPGANVSAGASARTPLRTRHLRKLNSGPTESHRGQA